MQFIISHDKTKTFLFATLQSGQGKEAIKSVTDNHSAPSDSVILYYRGRWYLRSSAALYVFRLLGWPWKLLYAVIIVPRLLRDWVYNIIAQNRYKWFGKRDECMIPDPDIKDRFLS